MQNQKTECPESRKMNMRSHQKDNRSDVAEWHVGFLNEGMLMGRDFGVAIRCLLEHENLSLLLSTCWSKERIRECHKYICIDLMRLNWRLRTQSET